MWPLGSSVWLTRRDCSLCADHWPWRGRGGLAPSSQGVGAQRRSGLRDSGASWGRWPLPSHGFCVWIPPVKPEGGFLPSASPQHPRQTQLSCKYYFQDGGTHVHLWLIHVGVWQTPSEYCKIIIFQLKKYIKRNNLLSPCSETYKL